MKKYLGLAAIVCGLMLMAAPVMAQAPVNTIIIDDSVEGSLTVTSYGIDLNIGPMTPEGFTANGIFHIPFGNGTLNPGTQSIGLYEPPALGGGLSDVVWLTVSDYGAPVGNDWQQSFQMGFVSDPFPFEYPTPTRFLTEDGTMQSIPIDQGGLVGGTVFQVFVQSDVQPDVNVPEPTTMLLLGLGLVGVAGARKFKK